MPSRPCCGNGLIPEPSPLRAGLATPVALCEIPWRAGDDAFQRRGRPRHGYPIRRRPPSGRPTAGSPESISSSAPAKPLPTSAPLSAPRSSLSGLRRRLRRVLRHAPWTATGPPPDRHLGHPRLTRAAGRHTPGKKLARVDPQHRAPTRGGPRFQPPFTEQQGDPMRAARTFLAAAGLGTGLAMALTTGPAHAAATSYVALGDSYSSGTGTRTYISDGTSLPALGLRLPVADRRGKGLHPELPGLLRRQGRRRDEHPARAR